MINTMKSAMVVLTLAVFVSLFAACAVQQSFDARLAQAYSVNTEIRTTATAALNAGRMTSAEGESVLKFTDQARTTLDAAASGDERGLALALEIMETLEDHADGN